MPLLIFDCDGVLIDSELLGCEAESEALANYGIHITASDIVKRFTGMKSSTVRRMLAEEHKTELPDNFPEIAAHKIEQAFTERLEAIEGISNALDALKDYDWCIASGSDPDRLKHSLTVTGLYDRFAPHIFSAENIQNGKPAPDIFLHAAQEMGYQPKDSLVIEDSVAGVTAGKAANMVTLGFTGGSHCTPPHTDLLKKHGADIIFDDMTELPGLIARFLPLGA